MCGRYALAVNTTQLAAEFEVSLSAPIAPRYNIAPSQPLLAVRHDEQGRNAVWLKWGLVPSWSKDLTIAVRLINARSETVAEKPAFRNAFNRRRALVPASGYYEWQARGTGKQPYYIYPTDRRIFAIAAVWERWERDGTVIETCALLTCAANTPLAQIHARMPVVIERANYADWLAPDTHVKEALKLLRPAPDDRFALHAVSRRMNSARNDDAACTEASIEER
jgi:putative SOS response-associated peptidase YedK